MQLMYPCYITGRQRPPPDPHNPHTVAVSQCVTLPGASRLPLADRLFWSRRRPVTVSCLVHVYFDVWNVQLTDLGPNVEWTISRGPVSKSLTRKCCTQLARIQRQLERDPESAS